MLIVLFSMAVSLLGCVLVPVLLRRHGMLDVPTARSSHACPTPKGGGAGMVVAFAAIAFGTGVPMAFWVPLLALAVVHCVNDLRSLAPRIRLVAQGSAALAVAGWGWWSGIVSWPLWSLPAVVFFVMATANCYNFMDGINGMAGMTGVVAVSGLLLHGGPSSFMAGPELVVLGSLLVFLPFNVPRARVFMGDVGSIFLGCLFALHMALLAGSWTEFWVLCALLFPFYADETATVVERLWRRESLLLPHRRHLYQFLANELGWTHWQVSLGYVVLQAVVALAAWALQGRGASAVCTLLVGLGVMWIAAHWLVKRRYGGLT